MLVEGRSKAVDEGGRSNNCSSGTCKRNGAELRTDLYAEIEIPYQERVV